MESDWQWTPEALEAAHPVPPIGEVGLWRDWCVARILDNIPEDVVRAVMARHLSAAQTDAILSAAEYRTRTVEADVPPGVWFTWNKSIGSAVLVVGVALFALMLPRVSFGMPGLLAVVGLFLGWLGLRVYRGGGS